ncbi:F-box DNA helicase 1-like [Oncorhynchus clarkii lewisi]|uniref:F-box DNA helicase 1-like n=1 Tax=Oncorhynchus clarkii lewisi TaxID=490388 RepID=UPI0039B9D0FD
MQDFALTPSHSIFTWASSYSFIRRFTQQSLGGYFGLKSYAKKTEDRELEGKLSMVEKYNSRIPELVERLYGCTEREAQHADFILGTVHKSKGLEFDTVVITDDFAKVPCAAHNLPRLSSCSGGDVPDDEWNLLYVAVTRAKSSLVITKNITNILTLAGEYFLRTELTSTLLTEGQPPCCSVRECHNHIMPVWPLAMCKLPLQYVRPHFLLPTTIPHSDLQCLSTRPNHFRQVWVQKF